MSRTSRQHKLWWQSSYDRGLDVLLLMWPEIKEAVPDATLDICYGWDLFVAGYSNNPERMKWMDQMNQLMRQDGITHHGRIGQKQMRQLRKQCGILAYPTYFTETNFIGGLESQLDGLVPVTMNLAALNETIGSGIKLDGNIRDQKVRDKYIKELVRLMKDKEGWETESKKAQKWAKKYSWENIADQWLQHF